MFYKHLTGVLRDLAGGGEGGGTGALTMDQVNVAINGAVAKIKTEMTGTFTTMLKPFEGLGAQLTTLTENLAAIQTTSTEGKGKKKDGAEDELPPAVALQIKNLNEGQKKLTDALAKEQEKSATAEKKAKDTTLDSELRTALDQFNFVNPEAKQDAFTLLRGQVEFGEDGSLVAGGLPMPDFVKDFIPAKKGHLLATEQRGGAGAKPGSAGAKGSFQFEKIGLGMTADDTKQAATAILAALPQR